MDEESSIQTVLNHNMRDIVQGFTTATPSVPHLDLPKYQWWYDAIVHDRQDVIRHHLRSSTGEYKNQLLNGKFDTLTVDCAGLNDKGAIAHEPFQVFLPFNLALVYSASKDTIGQFLANGVDATIRDHNGNNCVHVLITMAFLKPGTEDYMRELFSLLSDYLPKTVLRTILFQEDHSGFRPLELAANIGTFGLFLDIFHTKDVYLTKESTRGIYLKQYFDVTEYESISGTRRHRSPLVLLGLLDMESVDRKYTEEMFTGQHINQWIRSKFRKNAIFFVLWFLTRVILLLGFVMFDNTYIHVEEMIRHPELNDTQTCLQRTLPIRVPSEPFMTVVAFYLLIHAVIGLGFDIWEIGKTHKSFFARTNTDKMTEFSTVKGNKNLVVYYWTYRISQCIINVGILFNVIVRMLRYEFYFELSLVISSFVHLVILTNIASSFIFFLQLVPKLGFYAVVIQRMSSMFMNYFFILYITVGMPFIISFNRIVNFGKVDCVENFSSVWQGMYSTFLITFNMLDFQGLEAPNEQLAALYLIHVAFVLLVGVLLVNFLIALFTYHVGYVLQSSNIIIPVQCIFLTWLVEDRIRRISKTLLARMEQNNFITDNDGKLYISQILVADKGEKKVGLKRSTSILREHPLMRKLSDISDTDETFL